MLTWDFLKGLEIRWKWEYSAFLCQQSLTLVTVTGFFFKVLNITSSFVAQILSFCRSREDDLQISGGEKFKMKNCKVIVNV
jgi:hypothetical protein